MQAIKDVFTDFSNVLKSDYKFTEAQNLDIRSAKFLLLPKLERYIRNYCIFYFQGLRKHDPKDIRILDILVDEFYYKKQTTFPPLFYDSSYFKKEIKEDVIKHYENRILRFVQKGKENFLNLPKLPKLPKDVKKKKAKINNHDHNIK